MTLPDRILRLADDCGGQINDPDAAVYATIAIRLGIRDVDAVEQACSSLVSRGLLVRSQGRASGRYVKLTEKGATMARNLPPATPATTLHSVPAARNGAQTRLEPIDLAAFKALPRSGGRISLGAQILRDFLDSGLDAAKVVDPPKPAGAVAASIQKAIREKKLTGVAVRRYGGTVYLGRLEGK